MSTQAGGGTTAAPLRCLTVRQPWAWATGMDEGGKDVENRSGGANRWRYRGTLLIHAGKAWSERGRGDTRVRQLGAANGQQAAASLLLPAHSRHTFPAGRIVTACQLVDAHDAEPGCCDSPWAEYTYTEAAGRVVTNIVHLVLTQRRPVELPGIWPGRLGLWKPPPELAALWAAAEGE